MKAVLLAAGRGARLGEYCEHTPKPMVPIAGRPVIDHTLAWLRRSGVSQVFINVHHLGEVIEERVGDGSRLGLDVQYSRESELRGTAGALRPLAQHLQDGPFLVVYADNYFDFDLPGLFDAHACNAAVATLALFSWDDHPHTQVAGGRVEMDRSGRILRMVEGLDEPALRYVNAGCYVVEPRLLDHIPDEPFDFGHDLFPLVLRHQGILCGHLIDGICLGLDTPDALQRARRLLGKDAVAD